MTISVGINGFGRIGRSVFSYLAQNLRNDITVTRLNAPGDIEAHAHLLRFDSVHGRFPGVVDVQGSRMQAGCLDVDVMSDYNLENLDWSGCDVVLECTGQFNDGKKANIHMKNGAKSVLFSAPAVNVDKTVVFGVNHRDLLKSDKLVSNASCTTNCLAPLAKALHEGIGIESGFVTTIHSYTGDQPTLDRRHKDLYRARAAAMAMIPTSTGAARAVSEVLPELAGRLDGSAVRVPTPNVSCVDMTFVAEKDVTAADVNEIVRRASSSDLGAVLWYDEAPKVSIDFNHTEASSIFAPEQTKVVGKRLVRVMAWYDNEWGFSVRMADVAARMGFLQNQHI